MKNQIRIFLIMIAAVIVMSAAANNTKAQQITGGYGDAAVTDNQVKRAAAVAIRAQSQKTGKSLKLIKIEKAQMQVVAGMNYRICMTVREGRKKEQTVTAVVYQDLKKERSLSDWSNDGCKEI